MSITAIIIGVGLVVICLVYVLGEVAWANGKNRR